MSDNELPPSDEDGQEYTYCRYRRCGNQVLDARAYGLKAWRFPRRRRRAPTGQPQAFYVQGYSRTRYGRPEMVRAHGRSHPGQLTLDF